MVAVVVKQRTPARPEDQALLKSGDGDALWGLLLKTWFHEPELRPSAAEVRNFVSAPVSFMRDEFIYHTSRLDEVITISSYTSTCCKQIKGIGGTLGCYLRTGSKYSFQCLGYLNWVHVFGTSLSSRYCFHITPLFCVMQTCRSSRAVVSQFSGILWHN